VSKVSLAVRPATSFVIGVLGVAGICPLLAQHATAQGDSMPKSSRNTAFCWVRDEPENRSRAISGVEPVRLSDLPNDVTAQITGQLVLKLCIDTTGHVARTLTIRSSGSAGVDKLVVDNFARRQFKPVVRNGVVVPSAMWVTSIFDPLQ
jgi:hypothetical protein